MKQADPRKGCRHTEATKRVISEKKKGAPCSNPGYRHSDEMKAFLRKKQQEVNGKLTDNDVAQIRSLIGTKTQREIAEQFDVSISLVSRIKA